MGAADIDIEIDGQKHIHDHYMLRLSDAGFKTSDPTLVPAAGACGACPKRTGNQPELFGDVKSADVCTDPVCFRQKIAAHAERAIAAAAETGQTVLAGAEAKKVAKYGTDAHQLEGYVRLDARDYHAGSGKPRTFRQVLQPAQPSSRSRRLEWARFWLLPDFGEQP